MVHKILVFMKADEQNKRRDRRCSPTVPKKKTASNMDLHDWNYHHRPPMVVFGVTKDFSLSLVLSVFFSLNTSLPVGLSREKHFEKEIPQFYTPVKRTRERATHSDGSPEVVLLPISTYGEAAVLHWWGPNLLSLQFLSYVSRRTQDGCWLRGDCL